jgi:hypothetical protein
MMVHRPPAHHSLTKLKVVLLSGLSDPRTTALSARQTEFLAALDAPDEAKIYWNFPYVPCSATRKQPPLWLASWRNGQQFFAASRNPYRDAARAHWRALTASTDRLVVITLSCGVEIVNHCTDERDGDRDIHVVALGPVAWRRPALPHTLVQGAHDYISKAFFRHADVELAGVHHMNYLDNEQVAELCSNTLRSGAAASTCRNSG